jgi:hypothetical protein
MSRHRSNRERQQPGDYAAIQKRRHLVADLHVHKGLSPEDIAERLSVAGAIITSDMVRKDIRSATQQWKNSALIDIDFLKQQEIRRILYIYKESMSAWERSQEPEEATTKTKNTSGKYKRSKGAFVLDDEDEADVDDGVVVQTKKRDGNPAFLALAKDCARELRELHGLVVQPSKNNSLDGVQQITCIETRYVVQATQPEPLQVECKVREEIPGNNSEKNGFRDQNSGGRTPNSNPSSDSASGIGKNGTSDTSPSVYANPIPESSVQANEVFVDDVPVDPPRRKRSKPMPLSPEAKAAKEAFIDAYEDAEVVKSLETDTDFQELLHRAVHEDDLNAAKEIMGAAILPPENAVAKAIESVSLTPAQRLIRGLSGEIPIVQPSASGYVTQGIAFVGKENFARLSLDVEPGDRFMLAAALGWPGGEVVSVVRPKAGVGTVIVTIDHPDIPRTQAGELGMKPLPRIPVSDKDGESIVSEIGE